MGLFKYSVLALGTILAFTAGPAAAVPVTWQLQDAVLENGRTATGTFVFDADTDTYSSIDIETMPAPINHYVVLNPTFSSNFLRIVSLTGVFADYTGAPALFITWSLPFFTDAGGTVPFSLGRSYEGACTNADCTSLGDGVEFVSGKAVSIPEPTSLTLLAVGLFGIALGWCGVRRSIVAAA
jgi:PEP-CTERM motif